MQGTGFLAIWSDVEASQVTDYLHWLTREHTQERMGVDGFLAVRVFRAIDETVCRFLILYELEGPDALSGQSYLDRLNAPTPWSQRIMPILQNFVRGGGRRVLSKGIGQGGCAAALTFAEGLNARDEIAAALISQDRIAAAHILETDEAKTSIQTNEKSLRPKDQSFRSLLLVEGLDPQAAGKALDAVSHLLPASPSAREPALYAQVFALRA